MTVATTAAEPSPVLDGVVLKGAVNVPSATLLDQVRHAIRQGHPQVWRQQENAERVALVGGGPSLEHTFSDLVALVHAGAKLVTVNGAYAYCLDRNLKPHAQIVLDARPSTVNFLPREVPGCRYYIGSQCHAAVWTHVEDFEHVGIFHALGSNDDEHELRGILDAYYGGNWQGVAGGTTVTTRAIGLLRMLGYLRFDLFGVDSCFMGDAHHAYAQPENERDARLRVIGRAPNGEARAFTVSPWHLKQLEDILFFIRDAGEHFLLNVHGDGLVAFALESLARSGGGDVELIEQ